MKTSAGYLLLNSMFITMRLLYAALRNKATLMSDIIYGVYI